MGFGYSIKDARNSTRCVKRGVLIGEEVILFRRMEEVVDFVFDGQGMFEDVSF